MRRCKSHTEFLAHYLLKSLLVKKNFKILDAGCGLGSLSVELAKAGNDVIGVDFSKELIQFAKNNTKKLKGKVRFVVGDLVKELPFDDGFFDVIIVANVLHHFWDCAKIVKNLTKKLKVGGEFIIIEVNTRNPIALLCKTVVASSILFLPQKLNLAGHNSEFFHLIGTYDKLLVQNGISKVFVDYLPLHDENMLGKRETTAAKLYYLNFKLFHKISPRFYSTDVAIHGKKVSG